jgi:hypothetical protein
MGTRQQLRELTVRTVLELGGVRVNARIRQYALTAAQEDAVGEALQQLSDPATPAAARRRAKRAVLEAAAAGLAEWDYTDDAGRPVPATPESLANEPAALVWALVRAVLDAAAVPNSNAGTSPTPSAAAERTGESRPGTGSTG